MRRPAPSRQDAHLLHPSANRLLSLAVFPSLHVTLMSSKVHPEGPSKVEKLKELKDLLDGGVLTREEFDVQKAELLNPGGTQVMARTCRP